MENKIENIFTVETVDAELSRRTTTDFKLSSIDSVSIGKGLDGRILEILIMNRQGNFIDIRNEHFEGFLKAWEDYKAAVNQNANMRLKNEMSKLQ